MVSAPNDAGPKKRLVIKKMVLENFKSYAGAQHVGPFHKVRHVVVVDVAGGVAGRIDARRATRNPTGTSRLDPDTISDAPTRVSARGRPAPRPATRPVVVPPRGTTFFSLATRRIHPSGPILNLPPPLPPAVFLLRGWSQR